MLARKITKNKAQGLKQDKPEHTNYVVINYQTIVCIYVIAPFFGKYDAL
jgi:hypothetical protein